MRKKAVFIDRDGTLSKEVGYVNHVDRFHLIEKSAEAIKLLNESDLLAIVVTNQAGVARGYFPEWVVDKIHQKMHALLKEKGAYLNAVYYCPHHPQAKIERYRKNCPCRKPKTGMLKKAAKELNIDLDKSYIIGDKYSDIDFGKRVGATTIMVKTGYGKGEILFYESIWQKSPPKPDFVADNLFYAVKWILNREYN
ncbi:MAG: D,D-heptose 1,7-bisphosphate phosphatase [Deltaproteobacteria bacterium]|nr:HAD family hydrolase [Deltaproteobacteria bacterium]RLA89891.1 MAG: D,D-heptose 1,7-bisphosphate phosphatase [Deltaproteobacteria bacterium]